MKRPSLERPSRIQIKVEDDKNVLKRISGDAVQEVKSGVLGITNSTDQFGTVENSKANTA